MAVSSNPHDAESLYEKARFDGDIEHLALFQNVSSRIESNPSHAVAQAQADADAKTAKAQAEADSEKLSAEKEVESLKSKLAAASAKLESLSPKPEAKVPESVQPNS